jgi:LuxR family transcriptional regulator, maltose regulon positive regulatory protein
MVPRRPTIQDDPSSGRLAGPSFPILEAKLHPHLGQRNDVARTALLDRLQASSSTPVMAVIAPPGYGKTTVLAQWAERDRRPFAWVSVDQHDNDPAVLLTYVAAALDRVEPIDPAVFHALASPGAPIAETVLPRLASFLSTTALPVVLVLDDVHLLQNWDCLDAVATLSEHLPERSQLVIASRGELPPPLAGLRSGGRMQEIGPDDLAMSPQEARLLLRAAEVHLSEVEVDELVRRTEGWPVALYLAALSAKAGPPREGAAVAFAGDDRFLVEYLQSVLLTRLPQRLVSFLTRTAVLDQLSAPLCDAILGRTGSARVLESLQRSNMLVIPLDRDGRWYRYHQLFRELLRAELERREPALAHGLVLRAADWCEVNGLGEAAIDYAMAAGDADRAARLLVRLAFPVYYGGRMATLQRWFDWFDRNGLLERYPAVAVLGAWAQAFVGHPAAVERWADAAERGAFHGTLPDGTASIDGWLALLRAVMCRNGVERMRTDAEVALALIPAGSLLRPPASTLLGLSHLLTGDPELADRILADAAEDALDSGATDTAVVALAERCILAMGRADWREAAALAERALATVHAGHLEDYLTNVLLYAAAARVAIHRGELARAHEHLARAQRLRPQATYALPVYAVQSRLELAGAYIELADAAAARTVLWEVDDLLLRRPDLGVLRRQTDELRARLDGVRVDAIGASSLTAAELRLLRLLGTHHSFRGIGEQLYLSRHTVKSHAMSIYRKLGVSSRGEAIQRARDLGLLAD